eukprot:scaffold1208_cov163-Ochromonas_danica.AAC.10
MSTISSGQILNQPPPRHPSTDPPQSLSGTKRTSSQAGSQDQSHFVLPKWSKEEIDKRLEDCAKFLQEWKDHMDKTVVNLTLSFVAVVVWLRSFEKGRDQYSRPTSTYHIGKVVSPYFSEEVTYSHCVIVIEAKAS